MQTEEHQITNQCLLLLHNLSFTRKVHAERLLDSRNREYPCLAWQQLLRDSPLYSRFIRGLHFSDIYNDAVLISSCSVTNVWRERL